MSPADEGWPKQSFGGILKGSSENNISEWTGKL